MDTFQVEFPAGADVATKALLMGATMLVVRKQIIEVSPSNSLISRIICTLRGKTVITVDEVALASRKRFIK